MALTNLTKPRARWATFKLKVAQAVSRSLYDKLLDQGISVKDFGADSTGTTNCSTEFTNAVSLANTLGYKRIYVPDGQYLLQDEVVLDGVSISGYGTLIKDTTTFYGLHIKGRNVKVDGLTFAPKSASGQPHADIKLGEGAYNPTIVDCIFEPVGSGTYSAIIGASDTTSADPDFPYTNPVEKLLISRCVFEGYVRPLYLLSIKGFTITDNRFEGSSYDAIRIREAMEDGVISDNMFVNIGDYTAGDEQTRDAIDTAWSGRNLIIANNIIKRTAYCGIDIKGVAGSSLGSSDIIITGNHIEDTHMNGIAIGGDGRFTISDNTVTRCNNAEASVGDGAIEVKAGTVTGGTQYITISGNKILFNKTRGIIITPNIEYFVITDNLVLNNSSMGIYAQSSNYGVISNNIVVNDPALDWGDKQEEGIVIACGASSIPSICIESNIVKGNTVNQIGWGGSGNYQDAVRSFRNNYEEGVNAYGGGTSFSRFAGKEPRVRWTNGTTPSPTAGMFYKGDILYYEEPVPGGAIGKVATADGIGSAAIWKNFGAIAT